MAYDTFLAERIKKVFTQNNISFEEKKMMGGVCFMVNDKMCTGVIKDQLMVRLDPEIHEEALTKPGCIPMDFTGASMRGFVFLKPEAIDMDTDLENWIALALEYNPRAKSSKKKKG